MTTVSRLCSILGAEKNENNCLNYKYSDLKRQWIIHEGILDYFYGENLFKTPLFKKYFVVLTCISNEPTKDQMILLYIYLDKEKNPQKTFHITSIDELNDRCQKVFTGPAGLFFMELILEKQKSEIFGTSSVPERMLWIEKFQQAKQKSLNIRPIIRTVSDGPSVRPKSSYKDSSPPGIIDARAAHENLLLYLFYNLVFFLLTVFRTTHANYVPFKDHSSSVNNHLTAISLPNDLSTHRSCQEFNLTPPTSSYNYYEMSKETSSSTEFSWNDIFYENQKNDFAKILNDIGQAGVFLVRPKSKKTNPTDHVYTLCVLDSNNQVQNFPIHQSSDQQYFLTYRDNQPHLIDVVHLCEYYTKHPLYLPSKDGDPKIFYLTFPYTRVNLYY